MTAGLTQKIEERVLILAPIGRDARAAAQSLTDIELGCTICTDIADLHERLCEGLLSRWLLRRLLFAATLKSWNSGLRTTSFVRLPICCAYGPRQFSDGSCLQTSLA